MQTVEEKTCEKIWQRTIQKKKEYAFERIEESAKVLKSGNKMLDVGCGVGNFAEHAADKYNNVFGLDLSFTALTKLNSEKVLPVKSNFNTGFFPLKSDSFDTVTCLDVIEHVYDPEWLMSEIFRIIVCEGMLILTTPNVRFVDYVSQILLRGRFPKTSDDVETYNGGHINYFTFKDIRDLLKKTGFSNISLIGFGHRPYKSCKLSMFRWMMNMVTSNVEREFFHKGILATAIKKGVS